MKSFVHIVCLVAHGMMVYITIQYTCKYVVHVTVIIIILCQLINTCMGVRLLILLGCVCYSNSHSHCVMVYYTCTHYN